MGMLSAQLGSGPGYVVKLTAQAPDGNVVLGGTSIAVYQLTNAGVATQSDNGVSQNVSGEWLVAGTASDFSARGTFSGVSGGTTGGPTTYTNLASTQVWTLTSTNADHVANLLIEIRHDASGVVAASATMSMSTFGSP